MREQVHHRLARPAALAALPLRSGERLLRLDPRLAKLRPVEPAPERAGRADRRPTTEHHQRAHAGRSSIDSGGGRAELRRRRLSAYVARPPENLPTAQAISI